MKISYYLKKKDDIPNIYLLSACREGTGLTLQRQISASEDPFLKNFSHHLRELEESGIFYREEKPMKHIKYKEIKELLESKLIKYKEIKELLESKLIISKSNLDIIKEIHYLSKKLDEELDEESNKESDERAQYIASK